MSKGTIPNLQLIRPKTGLGFLSYMATPSDGLVTLRRVGRIRRRHRAGFRLRDS